MCYSKISYYNCCMICVLCWARRGTCYKFSFFELYWKLWATIYGRLRWWWSDIYLRRVGVCLSAEDTRITIEIICHYYVNNAMEHSRSWEANNSSVSQEIPRIIKNPKVHSRVYQSLQLLPVLGQINPLHTLQTDFFTIHCNIFLPSASGISQLLLSFSCTHQEP